MKNLFLTATLIIALSTNAATAINGIDALKEVRQEKEYTKIEATAVPAAILKEISDKYAGYVISEAHAAEDGSDFKIVLAKDKTIVTVYYTAGGEFVKEEKKS